MSSEPTTNRASLRNRLEAADALLKEADDADLARRYAATLLREAINPLEIVNNLFYLTKIDPSDPARVSLYMDMIREELAELNELTQRTLSLSKPPQG